MDPGVLRADGSVLRLSVFKRFRSLAPHAVLPLISATIESEPSADPFGGQRRRPGSAPGPGAAGVD